MKRLRRILFNALTAISLLLAIATAGLWAWSVHTQLYCEMPTPSRFNVAFEMSRGTITVTIHDRADVGPYEFPYLEDDSFRERALPSGSGFHCWYRTAKTFRSIVQRNPANTSIAYILFSMGVEFPFWLPILFFTSSIVILTWARVCRRSKARVGHCPACGYDMRANPATCSECGHEQTFAAAAPR